MVAARGWDGRSYDRISGPMEQMGLAVLDRLPLNGDETVLDAGCGSGRVTAMLLERLPRGRVVAVDASPSMVEKARESLDPARATVMLSDLAELELDEPVDAAFSNAVFHWVLDHERLFARLEAALQPGAPLIAQYGGEGNVKRFLEVASEVSARDPYAAHLRDFRQTWNFTSAEYARSTLEAAGFTQIEAWLEPRPMQLSEPVAFLHSVCLGPHLEHLPEDVGRRFVADVRERLGDPAVIDYVRLNISARKETA